MTVFSPDGAADYMRTRHNRLSDATFAHFIEYQTLVSERPDLIRTGSHVVDVVKVGQGERLRLSEDDARGQTCLS